MGVSTDAILVYGFEVEEGSEDEEKLAERQEEDDYEAQEKWSKKSGVEVVSHCSGSCTMFIIGITKSSKSASRGNPEKINLETLTKMDTDAMDKKLHAAAVDLGVKPKKGSWLLCSWWDE